MEVCTKTKNYYDATEEEAVWKMVRQEERETLSNMELYTCLLILQQQLKTELQSNICVVPPEESIIVNKQKTTIKTTQHFEMVECFYLQPILQVRHFLS